MTEVTQCERWMTEKTGTKVDDDLLITQTDVVYRTGVQQIPRRLLTENRLWVGIVTDSKDEDGISCRDLLSIVKQRWMLTNQAWITTWHSSVAIVGAWTALWWDVRRNASSGIIWSDMTLKTWNKCNNTWLIQRPLLVCIILVHAADRQCNR
jgi:hypothetical protein